LEQITALSGCGTVMLPTTALPAATTVNAVTRCLRESSEQPQDLLDEESSAPILLCVAMAPVSPLFQKLKHF
jgi:hypothetical protein